MAGLILLMAKRNKPTKASRKERRRQRKAEWELSPKARRTIGALVFFVIAAFSILSMVGAAGWVGGYWKTTMALGFGWGAALVPLLFFFAGYAAYQDEKPPRASVTFGIIILCISILGLLHGLYDVNGENREMAAAGVGGGYLGLLISLALIKAVGLIAAIVILLALAVGGVSLIADISLGELQKVFSHIIPRWKPRSHKQLTVNSPTPPATASASGAEVKPTEPPADSADEPELTVIDYDRKKTGKAVVIDNPTDWTLPPVDLLDGSFSQPTSGDIKKNAEIIEKTLANFGIDVEMAEVNIGPTVTQYTLKPAEGVKLSKILTLQNDLALALAAHPLRLEAPIPGRSLVGIEVPNKSIAVVRIREIIESETFQQNKGMLPIVLGRDVAGTPIATTLEKMPHLLIAGATGSGKSVCINALLMSLLYRKSPDELKLMLVDPKRVEMTSYKDIPHLITPVITDIKKTINALKWATVEMDKRLRLLSETGKRDIKSYNVSRTKERLPYIVICIDELADIMATAAAEVEGLVVRLAQMSRAVGIHLVLATQRPSVDVITGLIKANITSRVAFSVASQTDSRTILDCAGADKLLGNGDMLFTSAELSKPKRIQGAFVSEKEVENVCHFLKDQKEASYNDEVQDAVTQNTGNVGGEIYGEEDDPLLEDAKQEVIRMHKASASLLQRRLRIGYARAARLLDILEKQGVIGPADGAKPRDILVSPDNGAPDSFRPVDEVVPPLSETIDQENHGEDPYKEL